MALLYSEILMALLYSEILWAVPSVESSKLAHCALGLQKPQKPQKPQKLTFEVGECDGFLVGAEEGEKVGFDRVGDLLGAFDGDLDGCEEDGERVGLVECGENDGDPEGSVVVGDKVGAFELGDFEGDRVGLHDGECVVGTVGDRDGLIPLYGEYVGLRVGDLLGRRVGDLLGLLLEGDTEGDRDGFAKLGESVGEWLGDVVQEYAEHAQSSG